MTKLFISYAREDVKIVQKLEQALTANHVDVWRDQVNLYGGQQWPKAIGEAIATHNIVVLIWSKDAAASHYVEFEWTTAVALKKTILPCCLDETPLPPALSAINSIDLHVLDEVLPRILQALQRPAVPSDSTHNAEVIERLQEIAPAEPASVVQDAKAMFAQQGWNAQGERPIAPSAKIVLVGVTLLVGLLMAITLVADLPQKVRKALTSNPKLNLSSYKIGDSLNENLIIKGDENGKKHISANEGGGILGRLELHPLSLSNEFEVIIDANWTRFTQTILLTSSEDEIRVIFTMFTRDIGKIIFGKEEKLFSRIHHESGYQGGDIVNRLRLYVNNDTARLYINDIIHSSYQLDKKSEKYDRLIISGIKENDRLYSVRWGNL
jgi:hypothetical protein